MKKFRTAVSVIIMVIAGIVGFFVGASVNEAMTGAVLFSMISGIACIIYIIDILRNNRIYLKIKYDFVLKFFKSLTLV